MTCQKNTETVDQMMGVTVADIDYAVHRAGGCSHNHGTYQCGSVNIDGKTLHYYCCAGPGCGIILRGPC